MILINKYSDLLSFLQVNLLPCPFKKYLHMECPGCGMQRSILALLNGDLGESFQFHPAGLLLVLMALLLPMHLIFKYRHGAKFLVGLQLGIAVTSICFYVYKIINHQIFI